MISLLNYIKNKLRPVLEMAQVNTKDNSYSYFPWNKYKLCVYGNDHNPPHFHIISKQNKWKIKINALTGELYQIEKYGNRSRKDKFPDIVRDAKKWLNDLSANADYPNMYNWEVVRLHWNANNPELEYKKEDYKNENI